MTKRKLQNKLLSMINDIIYTDKEIKAMAYDDVQDVLHKFNVTLRLKKGRRKK